MNIGIDFHDALSANPQFYKKLISKWDDKIHIITGTPESKREETIQQLSDIGLYPFQYKLLMGFEYQKEEMTMDHFQKMKEHKLKLIQDNDIKVYFDDNPFYVDYLRNKGILVFQQILSDQYIDEFSKKDKYFTCHFQRNQFDYTKNYHEAFEQKKLIN